jgi:D-alanine-D-alanine ligase
MRIALLTGGSTGERDVSIASAQTIVEVIDFAGVEVFVLPEQLPDFLSMAHEFDLAIPMIHGVGGEDGSLQGLLEQVRVPHLFGNVRAHAIGIDKALCKTLVNALGVQVPYSYTVWHPERSRGISCEYPVFVKSNTGGSSLQMGRCENQEELETCLASGIVDPIIEQAIEGREFTVGVIEKEGEVVALPVIEIVPKSAYFDYESKYQVNELAEEVCPAQITAELSKRLQEIAVRVHNELGVQHLSRSDFMVTPEGEIYFIEINTIPGMTQTSLVPKALEAAGVDLLLLIRQWCDKLQVN